MDTSEKIRLWFEEPIETLIAKDEHTGFAVLMITLPLLERYVRRKRGIKPSDHLTLESGFFHEICELFDQFPGPDAAQRFWHCYRHGLLHQATLQLEKGATIAFVHDSISILECSANGLEFNVGPSSFARKVLSIIKANPEMFDDPASPNPPLSQVLYHPPASGATR